MPYSRWSCANCINLQDIPDSLLSIDANLIIKDSNSPTTMLLNQNKDDLIDKHITVILPRFVLPDTLPNTNQQLLTVHVDDHDVTLSVVVVQCSNTSARNHVRHYYVFLYDLSKWTNVLETSPDAMVVVDHQGKIVKANLQAKLLFRYQQADMTSQFIELLIPDRYHQVHVRHRQHFFRAPKPRPMGTGIDLYGRRSDGSEFPAEIMLAPLIINGETCIVASIRDVTERKRMEAMDRQNERILEMTKDNFVSNVSHDMTTPLHVIHSINEIVTTQIESSEPLDVPHVLDLLKDQREASNNLLHAIRNLLNYSSLKKGTELVSQPTHVNEFVQSLTAQFRSVCDNKGLQLRTTLLEEDPVLYIDKDKLSIVLNNLLSNAVKFTKQGYVHVNVVKTEEQDTTMTLRFEVIDTGIGIDEHFEINQQSLAWHRRNPSYTKHSQGLGIGLLVTQELLELFGSSLEFTSVKDMGSTFWFTLQLSRSSSESIPDLRPNEIHIVPSQFVLERRKLPRSVRILIVDDNKVNVNIMHMYCKALQPNIEIDVAYNGQEAVDKYKAKPYDFIIMDIQMPIMDGLEATKQIRQYEKEHNVDQDVTVILALTAHGMQDRNIAIQIGMNHYLTKPISMQTLKNLFDTYFDTE